MIADGVKQVDLNPKENSRCGNPAPSTSYTEEDCEKLRANSDKSVSISQKGAEIGLARPVAPSPLSSDRASMEVTAHLRATANYLLTGHQCHLSRTALD